MTNLDGGSLDAEAVLDLVLLGHVLGLLLGGRRLGQELVDVLALISLQLDHLAHFIIFNNVAIASCPTISIRFR